MSRALLGLAALTLASGCHHRFRQAAPHLDAVRAQVLSAGGPTVYVGQGEDLLFVDDILMADQGGRVEERLDRALDVSAMNRAFEEQLGDVIDGAPFELTEKRRAPLLQIEVDDYGMIVPALGQRGEFFYDLSVRIYDRDGRRIYKTGATCTAPVGDPQAISVALGTVDNAKQVEDMRKREIQAAFDGAARACANELVMKMRKHAGPAASIDLEKAWDEIEDALDPGDAERARDRVEEEVPEGTDEPVQTYRSAAR